MALHFFPVDLDHVVEQLTALAVDPGGLISLREFAELTWQVPEEGSQRRSRSTPEGRYSWIRTADSRGRDLPAAAGHDRGRLYRLGDLEQWLSGSTSFRGEEVAYDPAWALWTAARAFRREAAAGAGAQAPTDTIRRFLIGTVLFCTPPDGQGPISQDALDVLLAPRGTLVARRLAAAASARGSARGKLAAELLGLVPPGSAPAARAARAAAALLLSGCKPADLVKALFEHLAGQDAGAGANTTGQAMAVLMAALGRPAPGEVVVDPACGEGQLLLAAGRTKPKATLVGMERDPAALATAAAVLEVSGLSAELHAPVDSLVAADLPGGDLVLLDPPLRGSHAARWLRLAAGLAPEGRAVVVMPGASLQPGRREWPAVRERVAAVVACPARTHADTGNAPSVWVLGPSGGGDVLLADASGIPSRFFGVREAGRLADAVRDWMANGSFEPPPGVVGAPVGRAEIAAANGDMRVRTEALPPEEPARLARRLLESLGADEDARSAALRHALVAFLRERA